MLAGPLKKDHSKWWQKKEPNLIRASFLANRFESKITKGIFTVVGSLLMLPLLPYVLSRNIADWLLPLPPLDKPTPIALSDDRIIDFDLPKEPAPYLESWMEWSLRRLARGTLISLGMVGSVVLSLTAASLIAGSEFALLRHLIFEVLAGSSIVGLVLDTHAALASTVLTEAGSIALLSTLGLTMTTIASKIMHNSYEHDFEIKESMRQQNRRSGQCATTNLH